MSVTAPEAGFAALRTLLRSLGQIVQQPNAVTGAFLLAALLVCDPRLAWAALVGACTANLWAVPACYDEHDTRIGLHGFNGALAGLAAFTFIADTAQATAVAIVAATAVAWLIGPWSRWLRARGFCFYSSPCLIATWLWLPFVNLAGQPAGEPGAGAASLADLAHLADLVHLAQGLLAGLAQTAFASGTLPGLLILIGIAAASRRHALWALAGAALASAAQLFCGATVTSFEMGLLGFNGTLTALALIDCGALATLGGVALTVVLQQLFGHYGLPVLTGPFVAATWGVQWLKRRVRRLRAERAGGAGSASGAAAANASADARPAPPAAPIG